MDWKERRRQVDQEHQAEIRRILTEKRQALVDHLYTLVDPAAALQTVFNLESTNIQLADPSTPVTLSPEQTLQALDATEKWYTDRELPYPQPNWLKEQREYWHGRTAPQR